MTHPILSLPHTRISTRTRLRRVALLAVIAAVTGTLICALAAWATDAIAAPAVQSCSTPAANFSTLTTCRTQTAAATRGTSTATLRPSATPTKITPVPTLTELIVFVKVFIKFGDGQSVDSGIFPWRASQPVSCQLVRVDNFPQPTVTATP